MLPELAFLYQLSMSFNRLFDPLRFDADIPLRDGCVAVLQKPLDKRNIITVVAVDLCCVPFSETVCTDCLIAEIVTDFFKDFLHFSCRYGKDQLLRQAVRPHPSRRQGENGKTSRAETN